MCGKKKKALLIALIAVGLCVALPASALGYLTYIWDIRPRLHYRLHAKDCAQFAYIPDEDGNAGSDLRWGDITYTSYSWYPDPKWIGDLFGYVDGDPFDEVRLVPGQDPSEWVVVRMNILMGWDSLYKADGVTEIPEEFLQARQERNDSIE